MAIAFAREGADVLISYLSEEDDARDTASWVERADRKSILFAGDISDPDHCRHLIDRAVIEWGGIDILVNNAAHQMSFDKLQDISEKEWERTFAVNIH